MSVNILGRFAEKKSLVGKSLLFCVGEYAEYGFDQQRANARNVS